MRWICGVKPKLKAVNKPLPHCIVHELDKPGSSATVSNNATKTDPDEAAGAVRAGKALLAGLLRWGHCGRKLKVSYWGKSGTTPTSRCQGTFEAGGTYCIVFGGASVDRRLTQELLRVISPGGLQASLEAIEGINQREYEQRRTLEHKLAQLQYEAQRAFAQYNEVDPLCSAQCYVA